MQRADPPASTASGLFAPPLPHSHAVTSARLPLRLQWTRRPDGAIVFRILRPDGSSTWQRGDGAKARFFVIHDLTHWAVESVLGHRRGFYGLVADGWDITDFGAPWPRGPMPSDMDPSEAIVGALDTERASGEPMSAADLNAAIARMHADRREGPRPVAADAVSDAQLDRIREHVREQFARWLQVSPGDTLEVAFPPS